MCCDVWCCCIGYEVVGYTLMMRKVRDVKVWFRDRGTRTASRSGFRDQESGDYSSRDYVFDLRFLYPRLLGDLCRFGCLDQALFVEFVIVILLFVSIIMYVYVCLCCRY